MLLNDPIDLGLSYEVSVSFDGLDRLSNDSRITESTIFDNQALGGGLLGPITDLLFGAVTVPAKVVTKTTFIDKMNVKNLVPTHGTVHSKRQFKQLKDDIRTNGIKEAVVYTQYKGKNYILDGHHRTKAARILGIEEVNVIRTDLPYKSYKSAKDLFDVY